MWKSIDPITIATLPVKHNDTLTINLPDRNVIPDAAKEILIYAWIASGETQPRSIGHFKISVSLDQTEELIQSGESVSFYLLFRSYPNKAVSYNSDNVWLPMPKDRELKVRFSGTPLSTDKNVSSAIQVIGYKT